MQTRFIYFDLGNVLLRFCRQRQFQQMADVAGLDPEQVRVAVMESGLHEMYESGAVSTAIFFQRFCQATGACCDDQMLRQAGSDIFWPNYSMIPLVAALRSAGYRLGVLSNTNPAHWEWISQGRFGLLPGYFEQIVLSYQVGAMKPARNIYQTAVACAGVEPAEIFYMDDIEQNVMGAQQAGFDAVTYTTTDALVHALRQRGLRFNY
ncbi:MAG: HAD-IA family hydrolase [Planctomycetales bacterium]|nr:HAD-IA family hydrolase [Planctomycetales bacterium]NIM09193.1 HAD-IA family hydrolase [Planctomycetales bacterium]NIN08669.1 HAD-IA family hydrolase [Planctomycetales bacterium]NIN77788.1 HAD-IA family hydrolase [Planctomycetales bacterium]NIO34965.1 HAD-IA family hydrolase [Planctomycetales bacterium]